LGNQETKFLEETLSPSLISGNWFLSTTWWAPPSTKLFSHLKFLSSINIAVAIRPFVFGALRFPYFFQFIKLKKFLLGVFSSLFP
jgi:hypothetical protein